MGMISDADSVGAAMRIKYPRTPHLPWSPGMTSEDRVISVGGMRALESSPLVVTEKMDGGNVTLMRDAFYARSIDSGTPRWERYAKSEWARIAHDIPAGWRVSAESLWARRSVAYDNLEAPILVFGVWSETCLLSWEDTEQWAEMLGLHTVPVLGYPESPEEGYRVWSRRRDERCSEGFVVRDAREFSAEEFPLRVAKWVRPNHVQTAAAAWRHQHVFPVNGFRGAAH